MKTLMWALVGAALILIGCGVDDPSTISTTTTTFTTTTATGGGSAGTGGHEAGSAGTGNDAGSGGVTGGNGGTGADGGGGSTATGGSAGTGGSGGAGGSGGEAGSGGGAEPICPPNDTQCDDLDVETCNEEGTAWEFTETCDFVCSDGACIGICVPDSTQCDGDDLETCNAQGEWGPGSPCPFVCLTDTCTGVCVPNTKQCDGTSYQTCSALGQWGSTTACPTEAHQNPTCSGNGICGTTCQNGWDDCTGDPGCESDLADPDTCGSCSNDCDETNGAATCSSGTCGINCNDGWDDCTGSPGCETPLGTISNCLSCGDICSAPNHATAVCTPGGCDFECSGLWDNCDGNDGNGCEKDVSADAFNCGGCDTSCYGGACSGGACTPNVTFVADASNITSLALGTPYAVNEVYWTAANGTVNKAPADGGSTTVLATGQDTPEAVQTDGLNVIWSKASVPKAIRSIPHGGGSPTDLVTGHGPVEMTHDDQYLYWTAETDYDPCYCWDPSNTPIYKMGLAGGVPTIINDENGPNPLLWNSWPGIGNYGNDVYRLTWQDEYATGCLYMQDKVNPVIHRMACNINIDDNINSFTSSKYLTVSPNGTGVFLTTLSIAGHAIVKTDPTTGVSSLVTYVGNPSLIRGLAADDTNVYVLVQPNVGWPYQLLRYALSGGVPDYLISNQYNADNILVDATHVYWSIEGLKYGGDPPILDPVIVRMPK